MAISNARGGSIQKSPLYGYKAEKPTSSGENIVKNATNWLFFWLVAGITIAKDLVDLLLNALEGVFIATAVGIPISVLIMILGALITFTVMAISMTYFVYTKKNVFLRLAITIIGAIMGMIPVVSLLPETTIAFFGGFFIGNIINTAKKVLGKVASTGKNRLLET